MEPYSIAYHILASDVDRFQRLRLSRLFTFLQEAAIAHTEALGMGRVKTLDKGYLWVVTVQQAKITRLPVYDEDVTLESLPGKMMHTFYQRYTRLLDKNGNELVNAAALWMLMDETSRTMLFPEKTGVVIPDGEAQWQTFWPRSPRLPQGEENGAFTVPYSYVDLNGHMNNTRYFDLAEDCMPDALRAGSVREVSTEYTGEVTEGQTIRLTSAVTDGEFRIAGNTEKKVFRISMRYE